MSITPNQLVPRLDKPTWCSIWVFLKELALGLVLQQQSYYFSTLNCSLKMSQAARMIKDR
jgi:hypothetical protein